MFGFVVAPARNEKSISEYTGYHKGKCGAELVERDLVQQLVNTIGLILVEMAFLYPVHEPNDHVGNIYPEYAIKKHESWIGAGKERGLTPESIIQIVTRPPSSSGLAGWNDVPKLSTVPSRTGQNRPSDSRTKSRFPNVCHL